MVARDPETALRWTIVALLIAISTIVVPIIVWEFVWRHGRDNGVTTGIGVLITFVVAGPVGIKVTRFGKGNP